MQQGCCHTSSKNDMLKDTGKAPAFFGETGFRQGIRNHREIT